jgi:ABC-type transport system substrate-binding protein
MARLWRVVVVAALPLLAGAVRNHFGGAIQLSLPAAAVGVDPAQQSTIAEGMLAGLVFDGLYAWEPAGEAPSIGMRETQALLSPQGPLPEGEGPRLVPRLVPRLAASDPIAAADGRSFRIPIRPGLRFHDGRPVRAADVAASLARTLRGATSRWVLAALDGAPRSPRGLPAGIVVVSDTELELKFSSPPGDVRRLLAAPALAIASPGTSPARPVGTGPFRADEVSGGGVTLRASAAHFAGPPYLERVTALPARARNDEVRAFEVGQLWMSFHAPSVYGGQPRGGSRRHAGTAVHVVALVPRSDSRLMRDPEARHAVALAIDRARLSRFSITPVGILPAKVLARDLPAARAALARAVGRTGAPRRAAGPPAPPVRPLVTLARDEADAVAASIAEVVVASLDEIGLDVRLVGSATSDADLRLLIALPAAPDVAGIVAALLAASGETTRAATLLGRGDVRLAEREGAGLHERGTGLVLGLRTPVLHARATLVGLRFDPLGRLDLAGTWIPR